MHVLRRCRRAQSAEGEAGQLRCQRHLVALWNLGMPVLPQPRALLKAPVQQSPSNPPRGAPGAAQAAAHSCAAEIRTGQASIGHDMAELLQRSGSAERPRCAAWVGLDEGRLGRSEQVIAAAVQGDIGRMGYLLSQARPCRMLFLVCCWNQGCYCV